MKSQRSVAISTTGSFTACAAAALLMSACATPPAMPEGAAQVRTNLTRLQQDPALAAHAPVAMEEAQAAVQLAEEPQPDARLAAHRVYLADRKVNNARALAEARLAEDQRSVLSQQRDDARLRARTREADAARQDADMAIAETTRQRGALDQARESADAARLAATSKQAELEEMQREITALQAKVTERGLVVTLGDVLFASGEAAMQSGATADLNKLVAFLNKYPQRTVAIEGFTDSVGSEQLNQALSQRRADTVRAYLATQGISASRLTALGMGESNPVAPNDSAAGRQQNRRVELVIDNPMPASGS